MLTINESQLKILAESSFEDWLTRHVTSFFPQSVRDLPPHELQAWIARHHQRARRHFRSEAGVSLYLDLVCLFGDNFPDAPWAREILANTSLSDAQRRERLYHRARAHLLRQKKGRPHA